MRFRPCIDIHAGQVKQIVGSTLTDVSATTNFVSEKPASYFAELYRRLVTLNTSIDYGRDGLKGGHVILLGSGCESAALDGLKAYPGGLQVREIFGIEVLLIY